jgi:hypothetical protein
MLTAFSSVRRSETPFIATTKKSFQKTSKKPAYRSIFKEKYNDASSEGFPLTIRWVIWYKYTQWRFVGFRFSADANRDVFCREKYIYWSFQSNFF